MDKIDNLDRKILNILSKNARIPFKDVAAECNVSRAAIHQRVQHLIENGVIMGSGFDNQFCLVSHSSSNSFLFLSDSILFISQYLAILASNLAASAEDIINLILCLNSFVTGL